LETGALPIELLAYPIFGLRIADWIEDWLQSALSAIRIPQSALLGLFMSRVLATEAAVLAELEPLRRLLLVLRRAVVAPFALEARERDDVSHGCLPTIGELVSW
jgi:hypothetical protein